MLIAKKCSPRQQGDFLGVLARACSNFRTSDEFRKKTFLKLTLAKNHLSSRRHFCAFLYSYPKNCVSD
jgi:hypothetical protein